jgi:2-O-methyltransferase
MGGSMLIRRASKIIKILLNKNTKHTPIGEIPKQYIKNFLPDNPIIIEAGAHDGTDTVALSKLFPKGQIYAFEPINEIFIELNKKTKNLKNVTCYPLALSNMSGIADIYVSSGQSTASSSLLLPKEHLTEHPNVEFSTVVKVPTITLDTWAEETKVTAVDFLWLDMQGFELAALKASPRILSTVRAVYTEVSLKEVYEGCPLYPEVRQWFEEQKFRVIREELAWADMGNVLFARNY